MLQLANSQPVRKSAKRRANSVQLRCQSLEDRTTPSSTLPNSGFVVAGSASAVGVINTTAIATDSAGDAYEAGSFSGKVNFGSTTLTAHGSNDIFVAKYSAAGALLWVDDMGGSNGSAVANGIAVDGQGDAYLTGYFVGTVNFDPHSSNHAMTSGYPGNSNAFVEKLNSAGNYGYSVEIGSGTATIANAIAIDNQGNAYITGYFIGTGNFNPHGSNFMTSSQGGDYNAFVEKLNASGNYVWAADIGYGSNSFGEGIAVDNLGRVYTTGYFNGTGDFDPGTTTHDLTTSHGGTDTNAYLSILNSTGTYAGSELIGSGGMAQAHGIAVDKYDNIYLTGFFSGTGNFNPTASKPLTSSNGGGNINSFVEKLSNTGNFEWVEDLGYGSTDYAVSIAVDSQGNVYTVGAFSYVGDFNPGSNSSNLIASANGLQYNVYLSELNSSGQFVSDDVLAYGASELGIGGVAITSTGNVLVDGDYMGTGVSFDSPGIVKNSVSSASPTSYLVAIPEPHSSKSAGVNNFQI